MVRINWEESCTYGVLRAIFLIVDIPLDLTLHLIELSVEPNQDPCVLECLLLSIDSAMNHHLVVADGVGDMGLSRRGRLAESLQLGPSFLLNVELVDVSKTIILPDRGAPEHDQAVMHL